MCSYIGKLGELTLKGGNIKVFEKQLVNNTRLALEAVEAHVALSAGRLYIIAPKNHVKL